MAVGYVGRFAPSPTGPLHLGSLFTAVASYLHARQNGGEWLLRIEDIDPPREVPGAADAILRALEAYALHWDGSVIYQSSRIDRYRAVRDRLLREGRAFHCSCSRRQIRKHNPETSRYPGTCRERRHHEKPTATRVRVDSGAIRFDDALQGSFRTDLSQDTGDYVIWRRDDLPAYHLAVVLDDAEQGIDHVVRGADLLDSTAVHLHLQSTLGLNRPRYWHLPVLVNAEGQKLSKQTGAEPLDGRQPSTAAFQVLALLGLEPPADLTGAAPAALWRWALEHWRIETLAGRRSITPALPDPAC